MKGVKDIIRNYQPLTFMERNTSIISSAYHSVMNYKDANHYAKLTDLTSHAALTHIYYKMINNATGVRILQQKPRITNNLLKQTSIMNEGTFGKQYHCYMNRNNLFPNNRYLVKNIPDLDLAYIVQRYRQIHDFLHVLLQKQITLQDELLIKWFEMKQLLLPSASLAIFISPFINRLKISDIINICNKAQQCQFIMNIYFQQHLHENLKSFKQIIKI